MTSWHLLFVFCLLAPGVVSQDLEERVEVLEGQVSVLEDSVTVLDVEVDDVEGDLFIQSGRIDGLRDDVNLVQASVTGLDEDVEIVEDSVSAQDLKIAALEETNALLLSRLELLEIQLTSLNETVGDLDINNSTNERLDALESDVNGLGSNVTVLEGTITGIQDDVTSLEEEVSDLGEVGQGYPEATFLASFLTSPVDTTNPIVFDDAIINTGEHYDATTGIYTVPVDGVYQFVVHYMLYSPDIDAAAYLVVDNDVVAFTRVDTANPAQGTADIVVIVNLTAGQDVWVQPVSLVDVFGSNPTQGMYSWFSGHLIYRT